MSSGLGEDWERILEDLKKIAPIYERGNLVLSLGRSPKLRRTAVSLGLPASGAFLDVGSGPGSMSVEAKRQNPALEAVLLDPLPEMLSHAALQDELEDALLVRGVYEALPFRGGAFTGYLAGFTLRDARDRGEAVREARRALAPTGSAVMLDLGRPDSELKKALVTAYWRFLVPVMLMLLMGESGRPFRDIYMTIRRLPSNSQVVALFTGLFADVKVRKLMLDGVLVVIARSPLQTDSMGTASEMGLK
jgi:ubiquinone/menaquinone biosynthesis C-methylase UbiE